MKIVSIKMIFSALILLVLPACTTSDRAIAYYPLDRKHTGYMRAIEYRGAKPTCPTQVIYDDFGRPTVACTQVDGTAIFVQ